MTHQDVEDRDLVDRYVRGELDTAESEEFESHYFECDACFAAVRDVERLRAAAISDAHASPQIAAPISAPPATAASTGWTWIPLAASLVLAAGAGWMTLKQMPQLRSELAETERERDQLKDQAAAAATAPAPHADVVAPEANVPIAMLQSERDAAAEPTAVSVPAGASHVIVWINAAASTAPVRLIVESADGREISHADGLTRNTSGAYVVSFPAAPLTPAIYRLRLVGGTNAGSPLIGEYLLRVK
jgi:hypothetical protein